MAIRNSMHVPFHMRPKPAYLLWTRADNRRGNDVKTLHDYEGYRYLHTWQEKRCAMCGRDGEKLVLDHCHETGLARGFLCSSCNTKEQTQGNSIEWRIYKDFPPTTLLGLAFYYNDFGQSPYPIDALFSKDAISAGIEEWDDSLCYQVIKDFCNYEVELNWINSPDLRSLIRKSLAYVRDGIKVDSAMNNENADVKEEKQE